MEIPSESSVYKPCGICGRTFNPESLERHEKVCEKTNKGKQRRIFDSFQQRAKNVIVLPVKSTKEADMKKPKARWKEQHDQLNKKPQRNNSDSSLNNCWPSQKVIPLGYIQCPVCQRCFNHKAADRHIMWCQEQLNRLPKSPPSSEALQRLRARVKYRAPLPVKKRNGSPENNQRLVKSAESCKPPSLKRTFSSPGLNQRNIKQVSFQEPTPSLRRSNSRSFTFSNNALCDNYFGTYNTATGRNIETALETPVMKFKEKFPNYSNPWKTSLCSKQFDNNNKQRNSYEDNSNAIQSSGSEYDILNALQLQLSEMDTNDRYYKNSENRNNSRNSSTVSLNEDDYYRQLRSSSQSWSSSSQADENSQKMPKFCYQCGTKYPVLEAKFCCECGARRLVFGVSGDKTPILTSP